MSQRTYPSNLSNAEWKILEPLIPPPKTGGHPRTTDIRQVCNAIYYHLKTGCQWEYLPKDFPPPSTVYSYYRKWQLKGISEKMNQVLREQVREQVGKARQATIAIADSQSVKTTSKRGKSMVMMAVKKSKDARDNY